MSAYDPKRTSAPAPPPNFQRAGVTR